MTEAVHHSNIFKSMKDIRFEDTISHQCGITMNDSVEARAIADVMERKKGVAVTYQPSLIRIDGDPKLTFNMEEISEALGRPMTPHLPASRASTTSSSASRRRSRSRSLRGSSACRRPTGSCCSTGPTR